MSPINLSRTLYVWKTGKKFQIKHIQWSAKTYMFFIIPLLHYTLFFTSSWYRFLPCSSRFTGQNMREMGGGNVALLQFSVSIKIIKRSIEVAYGELGAIERKVICLAPSMLQCKTE
jgi:hypothetical protein